MWTRPEKPIKIHPSQLVLGLYVWIDLPWDAHPFLYNKFRISTESQLAEIQSLSLDQIYCFPNKSTSSPGPLVEDRPEAEVQPRHEVARTEGCSSKGRPRLGPRRKANT
jgi:hypothetical protein